MTAGQLWLIRRYFFIQMQAKKLASYISMTRSIELRHHFVIKL
nr:MAG TPA: hypothetical protein [Caudoviricetes sp.]